LSLIILRVRVTLCRVLHADFKDHKFTYTASNNIKGIGKSIGVKVSPLLFAKVSVSVSAILLVYSIGIVIGDTFCKYR